MTVESKQRISLRMAVIDNIIENYLYRDSNLVLAFQSKLTEHLDKKSLGPISKTTWEIIYFLCRGLYSKTDVAASDIYSSIGVSKTAVIRYLNRLEAWGIIERQNDPKDKRRKLLKFTSDFELNISKVVDHCANKHQSLFEPKISQGLEPAEQDRQDRLIKFKEFAEVSSDWFWETNDIHQFSWFSTEHSQFQDYNPKRKLGTKRWDYYAPLTIEERQEMSRHRVDLDARKPFRDFVFRVLLEDGREVWCSVSGNPMFDANGAFQGYFGNGKDVTDRRRLIDDLRRNEIQLRELNALAADCSWIIDKNFRYEWYSSGCRPSMKSPDESLMGAVFWGRVSPFSKDDVKRLDELQQTMKAHQPFYDVLGRVVDGPEWNVRWHRSSGVPLYKSDGSFCGYQGVCRDVTQQIRTEIINDTKIKVLSNLLCGQSNIKQLAHALGVMEQVRPGTPVGFYLQSDNELELYDGGDKKLISRSSEIMQAIEKLDKSNSRELSLRETDQRSKPGPNLFRLSLADKTSPSKSDLWVNLFGRPKDARFAVLAVEIDKKEPFGRDIMKIIREIRDLIGLILDHPAPTRQPNAN